MQIMVIVKTWVKTLFHFWSCCIQPVLITSMYSFIWSMYIFIYEYIHSYSYECKHYLQYYPLLDPTGFWQCSSSSHLKISAALLWLLKMLKPLKFCSEERNFALFCSFLFHKALTASRMPISASTPIIELHILLHTGKIKSYITSPENDSSSQDKTVHLTTL